MVYCRNEKRYNSALFRLATVTSNLTGKGAVINIVVAIVAALVLAQFIDGRLAVVLAFIALVGWRLLRRRLAVGEITAELRDMGFSSADIAELHQDLRSGNREQMVQKIAERQERQRADMAEAGIDVNAMKPEVGRDIAWTDIIRQVFRVLEFDRAGSSIGPGNTVRAASPTSPYGYLLVESPILNQPIRLPIVHRDDFLLAASVYEEPPLLADAAEEELLVTYAPEHKLPRGLAGISHALHYVVTSRGTLDRYYDVGNDMHMASPAPEKLLGPFVWQGEISVKINRHPNL